MDVSEKNFKAALSALGFRENVLAAFFRKIMDNPSVISLNQELISSIEGGVKDRLDFPHSNRTTERLILECIKSQTRQMYLMFIDGDLLFHQLKSGDLDLVVAYDIKQDKKVAERMYQALFEMSSFKKDYTKDSYNRFGNLLRHWRDALELRRYNYYVAGKSTYPPLVREADLFLKALERVHVAMARRTKNGR